MISRSNRYERWDGSQEPLGRDAEDLFDRLAEDLFQGGDFDYALHRLMSRGWRDRQGRKLPGFDEMLERLRPGNGRMTLEDVRKQLDAVNLGELTLQTMAFAEYGPLANSSALPPLSTPTQNDADGHDSESSADPMLVGADHEPAL